MEEALRTGVERIVYTSSIATIEPCADGSSDEGRPLSEDRAIGPYKIRRSLPNDWSKIW
jgi:dihydroflavonol-4-reductase